jgi:hypothetical protein
MIVTAKPPGETVVEAAPSTAPPQVPNVTASPHGKTRMAKLWERLGNPDAAASSFYNHAPTLSNY